MERKTGESEMNGIPASQIEDVVRSVFAAELPFSHRQDDLVVEISEKSVQVAYSSFELSDAPDELTTIGLRFRLDANELWIEEIAVAKPYRLQGGGRQLVQAAEMVAYETKMGVVNVFPLGSSGPFWAKLGYVPHRFAAKVLSKGCDSCTSIPSTESRFSLDPSFRTKTTQKNSM